MAKTVPHVVDPVYAKHAIPMALSWNIFLQTKVDDVGELRSMMLNMILSPHGTEESLVLMSSEVTG